MKADTAWVVTRIDHYLEDLYLPASSPNSVAQALVKSTAIWWLKRLAEEDAARLRALNGRKGVDYVVKPADATASETLDSAYVVTGVISRAQSHLTEDDVSVLGVFESLSQANDAVARAENGPWGSFVVKKTRTCRGH